MTKGVPKSERVKRVLSMKQAQASRTGKRVRWGRGYMLLPQEERKVAKLYREGKNFTEIASDLKCSPTTVTRTLERMGLR